MHDSAAQPLLIRDPNILREMALKKLTLQCGRCKGNEELPSLAAAGGVVEILSVDGRDSPTLSSSNKESGGGKEAISDAVEGEEENSVPNVPPVWDKRLPSSKVVSEKKVAKHLKARKDQLDLEEMFEDDPYKVLEVAKRVHVRLTSITVGDHWSF